MNTSGEIPQRLWARAKASGAHGLRRGSWYLVVNDSSKIVVLEVRRENVPVPRDMVEIWPSRPDAWSVVQWSEDQQGARRASEQNFGLTYGVCSRCGERQPLVPKDAQRMVCDHCRADLPVDWEHPC